MEIENTSINATVAETKKTKRSKNFKVENLSERSDKVTINVGLAYDADLNIPLPVNVTSARNIPLYNLKGLGFDPLLAGLFGVFKKAMEDSVESGQTTLSIATINSYYALGLVGFSAFLQVLSGVLKRDINWEDINRNVIDQYIVFLAESSISITSQKHKFSTLKSLLILCFKDGLLRRINDVKNLFPDNPYPNINKKRKGQSPYSKPELKRLTAAIRDELMLITEDNEPLTAYELGICVLAVALRTGLNPTPILELRIDCLQPHPLKSDLMLLASFKRRGNSTHVTALRGSEEILAFKAVTFDVISLIDMIKQKNQSVRNKYSDKNRLLVFSQRTGSNKGRSSALSFANLDVACKTLTEKHGLVGDDGNPLTVNLSKLRKSFVNRIFELSGGDPLVAARLGKHRLSTANNHYWVPPPEAEANHRKMIERRTQDLIATDCKGEETPTPIAMCTDTINGQRAPKDGSHCTEILACFRCKSFVVTKDDLHRLFSFYWAIVEDRQTTDAKTWQKHFRHIRQIIDENISPQFQAKFGVKEVEQIKQNAKMNRHLFWKDLTMLRMAK